MLVVLRTHACLPVNNCLFVAVCLAEGDAKVDNCTNFLLK